MKSIFTILIVALGFSINAQTDWNEVVKMDNIRNFVGHMGGASVNTCQDVNGVPYHTLSLAIKHESQTLIDHILVQEDLDLSAVCADKTILMYGIKYGNLDLVKTLISKGATISQKSAQGKSAIDYARKYQKREIYEYLKAL